MTNPVLYLREADVEQLVDMPIAMEAIEQAFRQLADRQAEDMPRARVKAPGIVLHSMSASAAYLGVVGWKQYTTTRDGARFLVGLHDQQSGCLRALIEANRLGQLRTGAVTGVAARILARKDAVEMGLFGSGWQAETQLSAVAAVRPLRQVRVFSRDAVRRAEFAARMSQQLQIEVRAVADPRAAVANLPIVVTATTSRVPVFDGRELAEGTFLAAVGSNWLEKAEVDVPSVQRAAVVCDSIAACQREAGELAAAQSAGCFEWDQAVDLSAVLAGTRPGRTQPQQIILFKSVGMAVEDVALGYRILELALQQGLGEELPF